MSAVELQAASSALLLPSAACGVVFVCRVALRFHRSATALRIPLLCVRADHPVFFAFVSQCALQRGQDRSGERRGHVHAVVSEPALLFFRCCLSLTTLTCICSPAGYFVSSPGQAACLVRKALLAVRSRLHCRALLLARCLLRLCGFSSPKLIPPLRCLCSRAPVVAGKMPPVTLRFICDVHESHV